MPLPATPMPMNLPSPACAAVAASARRRPGLRPPSPRRAGRGQGKEARPILTALLNVRSNFSPCVHRPNAHKEWRGGSPTARRRGLEFGHIECAEVPLQSPFSRHFVAHFVGTTRVQVKCSLTKKCSVYAKALDFAAEAASWTSTWDKKHSLVDHLSRATESILLNLAEVWRRPPSHGDHPRAKSWLVEN